MRTTIWRGIGLFLVILALGGAVAFYPHARIAMASAPAQLESGPLVAEMLDRLNAARVANGVAPLAPCEQATGVAVERALDMAANGYFAHVSPAGVGPAELAADQGIHYRALGENIASANFPVESIAGVVHDSLMNSPGHRRNILSADFSRVGVGIAAKGDTYYFAFVFLD
jgi:uncharacterized protein YkwD